MNVDHCNLRLTFLLALQLTIASCVCGSVLPFQPPQLNDTEPPAPATPLVACDPYFSIWSTGKTLNEVATTHWTGRPHRLVSLIRIDGKPYRLIGDEPKNVPSLQQVAARMTPTASSFEFEGAGVSVTVKFMTPLLADNIDQLSRPLTYVSFTIASLDGDSHDLAIYFSASGELTVNEGSETVNAEALTLDGLSASKIGSVNQQILVRSGDDLRIDWGHFYLATAQNQGCDFGVGLATEMQDAFAAGKTPGFEQNLTAQPANLVAAAATFELSDVGSTPAERTLVLAYDDLYSIEFMGRQLRPYWRRNGMDAVQLIQEAVRDHSNLAERCATFDQELIEDLLNAGGSKYAAIASLAYRQCFAAGKFVADANGQPIQFCKENNSNGCIATSDVFYPMSPQFLLFGSSLARSFVVPFMEYAASDRWKFPFAPHDLGTYPKANGQVYGGGELSEENQMPVEESANLLILMAAIAKIDGNADFAVRYWPQLEQWAEYLKREGFDPANQLCTDDFAGHLAHNVNLSAKAICGLGAFSQLCSLRGDDEQAKEYRKLAEEFSARWAAEADDGDHFRLAFDKPGSWSQKYNLVWDRILDLGLFSEEILEKEMQYYLKVQNQYGLPLDNRREYTKLDWILWTATLTRNRDDFEALVEPVYRFLAETPDRVPMSDWYETKTGRRTGFTARPVVGGVFMQLLHDEAVWRKWSGRDRTLATGYAKMPEPPEIQTHLAAADSSPALWHYTTDEPNKEWFQPDFDDSQWKTGESGFGTPETPSARIGTLWNTSDIWIRRSFDLSDSVAEGLRLYIHYDEDAEIYINGKLAGRTSGYSTSYGLLPILAEAVDSLQERGNVIAIHCHQTGGGQYIDAGLVTVKIS